MSNTRRTLQPLETSERVPLPVESTNAPFFTRATLFARLVSRAGMLARFVTVQAVVQILGAASGILLVRALSQKEYAYFTIANSMQATMNILADAGVGIGLSSIGGRVWQSPYRFGQLINTALHLRRYLAAVAMAVIIPILIWMLVTNGATPAQIAVLAVVIAAGLNFQLLTGVLMVVPRLHSQIGRVQKLDLLSSVSRIALLAVAYLIFLDAAVAMLATVVSLFAQHAILKRWVADSIDAKAPISGEDRFAMLKIVKSQAPNAVFYCLQGQLTIWLISFFGSTQNVAEVGALGRLGMIFSVVGAVMTSIVLPAFARTRRVDRLRLRYFQIVCGFVLFGVTLVSLAAAFPGQLLWVLGGKYAHLRGELFLMMILTAFNAVVAAMWSLNASKAWIKYSWLNIPGTIFTQALLLSLLDISSIRGVLLFGIFSLVPTALLNFMLTYKGLASKDAFAATAYN